MSLSEPEIFSPPADDLSVPPWVAEAFEPAREQEIADGVGLITCKKAGFTVFHPATRRLRKSSKARQILPSQPFGFHAR